MAGFRVLRVFCGTFALILTVFSLALAAPAARRNQAADKVRLTGRVSDTMCRGAAHDPARGAADCPRHCVANGSSFALVSDRDGKVYTLSGHDDELEKLAGQQAVIEGTVNDYNVLVTSVGPASKH